MNKCDLFNLTFLGSVTHTHCQGTIGRVNLGVVAVDPNDASLPRQTLLYAGDGVENGNGTVRPEETRVDLVGIDDLATTHLGVQGIQLTKRV